jgi:hypothetical protein
MTYSQQLEGFFKAIGSRFKRFGFLLAIPLSYLATGCTQQQIVYQAISHNRAISSSADEILLTNILRASNNLAIDYTAISGYQAEGVVSGSLSPKLPFGSDAPSVFSLDPVLNVSAGITSITVTNFGHQEKSYKNLHQPADRDDILRRKTAGWEDRLIETFLYSRITVRGKFWNEIYKISTDKCPINGNFDEIKIKECRDIQSAKDICGQSYSIKPIAIEKISVGSMSVTAKGSDTKRSDRCDFAEFQDMLSRFDLSGVFVRLLKKGDRIIEFGTNDELKDIYEESNVELSQRGLEALTVGFRSTDGMIKYVGQLVQAQLRRNGRWDPTIDLGESKAIQTPLFLIERGASGTSDSAISTSFDGQVYTIPASNFENRYAHRSMEIFSYIRERLDQAYAASEQPPSNVVVIR